MPDDLTPHTPHWGRLLDDFVPGHVYVHPWEVTLDAGFAGLWGGAFFEPRPQLTSAPAARALGFAQRPLPPMAMLNLALSFSVHDVSEQSIAHLAYEDARFPNAAHEGHTVTARSRVLDVRPSSRPDRGIVHVRTTLSREDGAVVCVLERKALVRAGRTGRTADAHEPASAHDAASAPAPLAASLSTLGDRVPPELFVSLVERRGLDALLRRVARNSPLKLTPGTVIAHPGGRTVGDSEHMQLSTLCRNTHPLHIDADFASFNDPRGRGSFTGKRIVCGGFVLAWITALAAREAASGALGHLGLWDLAWRRGAHPAPVHAGDTLHAASRLESLVEIAPHLALAHWRVIGVKNARPEALAAAGGDLFSAELDKADAALVAEKVVEVNHTMLVATA